MYRQLARDIPYLTPYLASDKAQYDTALLQKLLENPRENTPVEEPVTLPTRAELQTRTATGLLTKHRDRLAEVGRILRERADAGEPTAIVKIPQDFKLMFDDLVAKAHLSIQVASRDSEAPHDYTYLLFWNDR